MSLNRKLPARVRVADIITHAAQIWEVSQTSIKGKSRLRNVVHCRAAIAFVAKSMPRPPSYPMIGKHLQRDHSTVIHAVEKVPVYFDFAPDFGDKLAALFDAAEANQIVPRDRDIERFIERTIASLPPVDTGIRHQKPRNRFLSGDDELVESRINMRAGSLALADAIKLARAA